jgi:hypothetical protein
MNYTWRRWALVGLGAAVVLAAIYFPVLRRRLKKEAKIQPPSTEQARRELTQAAAKNPSDPTVRVRIFWASSEDESSLAPLTVDLALSTDPVLRSKQVINTLLAGPVDSDLKTLPPDSALLAFYVLPDGTGIADFSETLATSTPSGILSEQLAIDSITRTLEANVPQVKRLKILIHGQEVDTLAGHVDLTQLFIVDTKSAQAGAITSTLPIRTSVATVPAAGPKNAPDRAAKR